ncbi:MAG TPA: MFS transporter, partial [Anaerolineales bacterium]|nr:MFS transporter [Anaerolineales bacterium]
TSILMTNSAKIRNTIGYYLLFICLGFGMGITGPALPSLAKQTASTIGQIGMMLLSGSIGYTVGTLIGGRLFDRMRAGHPILGICQLVGAALLAAVPLAGSLPILLLIVFINGLPNGILNTGANTLLMWTHGEKSGPYINGLHFSFGLGAFLAPTIYAQILSAGGTYQQTYWILAGIAVPIALFMLLQPHSPEHPHKQAAETTSDRQDLARYLPLVISAMLFLFFYVGSEVTFGNWIYTYTLTLNLADATRAAYLTSSFWLAFTIGRLISIPVAARFKSEQILGLALIACLLITGLMIATPNSSTLLWACTIALGFFMAPVWPTGYNLAGQSVKLTATISSIILLGDSFGGMLLPSLTGQVVEHFGAPMMTWLVFGSLVGNLLMLLAMLRLRGSTAQEPTPAAN